MIGRGETIGRRRGRGGEAVVQSASDSERRKELELTSSESWRLERNDVADYLENAADSVDMRSTKDIGELREEG